MRAEQAKKFHKAERELRTALNKLSGVRIHLALGGESELITAAVNVDQVLNHLITVAQIFAQELHKTPRPRRKRPSKEVQK